MNEGGKRAIIKKKENSIETLNNNSRRYIQQTI